MLLWCRSTQMVEAKDETGDYGKVRETIADLLSETPDMGYALVRVHD